MRTYVEYGQDEETLEMWWYVKDSKSEEILSRYEDDGKGERDAQHDSMWYEYYFNAIDEGLSQDKAKHHANEVMKFRKDLCNNLGVTQ